MSKKDAVICDGSGCSKTSFDHMADGWIVNFGFIKYKGRNKDRMAETEIYFKEKEEPYHFCSWDCLFGKERRIKA